VTVTGVYKLLYVADPLSQWLGLIALLGLVLQRLGVTVTGVYRLLYVADPLSPWLGLIALLGLVKPFTFTEAYETEHEHE
jgi:hypothetical protein